MGICSGVDTVDMRGNMELARRPLGLPRLDTGPSRALHALLDQLRSQRGAYMFLRVARRCVCVCVCVCARVCVTRVELALSTLRSVSRLLCCGVI
jgi:hypothetical protein